MDEPIFSLNFPFCNAVKGSHDGKWTVVVISGIVYVYNMDGVLAGRLSEYYPHNSSGNLQVWGDKVAYLDEEFRLRIFLLPDFSEVETLDLSQWSVVSFTFKGASFTFNEIWIVFQESNQLPVAINRHHRNIRLQFERRLPRLPEFVNRDVVFFRHQIKDPASLYDLPQGEIIQQLPSGACAVSPDLRYCAVQLDHRLAEIWDINENRRMFSVLNNGHTIVFPDGKYVVAKQDFDRFVTHRIESGEIVSDFALDGHTYHQPQITQQFLTTVAASGWVRRYDLYTGQVLVDFVYTPGWIYAVKVAGGYMAIQAHYIVSIFDLTTAQIIWQKPTRSMQDTSTFYPHMVRDVALNGTWVTVQSEKEVEIWDFIEDRLIASCSGHLFHGEMAPPYLYFTGKNSALLPKLIKFDVEKQMIVAEVDASHEAYMSLTENCGLLMGQAGGEIKQLDEQTLSEIRVIAGPLYSDTNLKALSRETVVIVDGGNMKLISLEDGHVQLSLSVPYETIVLAIRAGGQLIVTTNKDERNTIQFWRPFESSILVYSITVVTAILTATFTDDRTLVTAHDDGTVNFWDITHITQGLV